MSGLTLFEKIWRAHEVVPETAEKPAVLYVDLHPGMLIEIDVERGQVVLPDGRVDFAIDPFAQHCQVQGLDEMGYLLSRLPEIESWERGHGR
ncbi:MAG: hypothetical protein ACREVI_12975 [Steroidobacteraceae bacterium]